MIPASSTSRISLTVRGFFVCVLLLGAILRAAPAFSADPEPPTIEAGVTIQGIHVGGMTGAEARAAVHHFATRPFTLTFRTRSWQAT